ncbi:cytochrome P450 [Anabaena sp. CCY 9402-a]|uniref:cytochrome P450 n=1 Tax=Anabaena sp. CCY 9402-a TaxID=3103867 RepID=UPI0039C61E3C
MESIAESSQEMINSGQNQPARTVKPFRFNPLLANLHQDPYPTYHRLRETDPVHQNLLNAWVLTRYEDVRTVLRDPRFCVDKLATRLRNKSNYLTQQKDLDTLADVTGKWLIYLDPPDHTRLRKLVGKAFSPSVIDPLRPYIQGIVDQLLDKVQHQGNMEVIADLAAPLPVKVIAKMLGVPDQDCPQLHQWSNDLSRILDPLLPLQTYEHLNQIVLEFAEYFRAIFAERRKSPQEDLISALIEARDQGDKLSEVEMLSTCILLFIAGEETTVNTIGNGILALLRHPEQLEKLRQEPTIIQSAVEEILRYDSPVQYAQRIATEDVEIGGKLIKVGDKVVACLGAANRDPAQFIDPDRLNLTRSDNRHMAFIDGTHTCLGGALARLNSQIAINTFAQRFSYIELQTDQLDWRKNIALRGLKSLSVSFKSN